MSVEKVSVDSLTPAEMAQKAVSIGINKVALPADKMFLLAIWAGMFIGLAAIFATVSAAGTSGVLPFGTIKVIAGLVFCLGLVLVVVSGAELFTGNILIVMAWATKKVSLGGMLRNWIIVYTGNFIGSILLAVLVLAGKHYTFGGGTVGQAMLSTALAKVHFSFIQAFALAIICNILVCLAVWMTYSARTTVDKVAIIIYPIAAFVAGAFEHSVANMYFIPLGVMLKTVDPAFVAKTAIDVTDLTWNAFFLHNLLPVTLGNIVGGLFVGMMYWFIYLRQVKKSSEN